MKEKLIIISLYILLAIIVCAVSVYWLFAFAFDDILNYYYGGVLKLFFILIMVAVIVLPIVKYRKHKQKWILPTVLCLLVLLTPIFNNGILKFVEDDTKRYEYFVSPGFMDSVMFYVQFENGNVVEIGKRHT